MKPLIIFALLFFCLVTLKQAEGHVLGIDFGTEYIKISGPHADNGVDIVLNEMSQRKTDDFIGFRFGDRYIGSAAKSLAARFPLQTVSSLNRLLSAPASEDRKAFEALHYEFLFEESKDGSLLLPIKDSKGPFTAEELYSMMLSYAARIAVKDGVPDPKTVVITVPANSPFYYREMVNYAAKLAGLKVLGLVDSTTATAYYYGMRHRGFGNSTVTLAIVDIGASHTEVGIFEFTPSQQKSKKSAGLGTITKRAVGSDFSFGGRTLDLCIAQIIEEEAIAKLRISPVIGKKSDKELKSQFSLMRAAKNVRETLSVNSDTPFTVEGIATDRDFSSTFSKATFEERCGHHFKHVEDLLQKVSTQSGIPLSQLNTVELMGGVSRTPKLIAGINKLLGHEVSRTLNMDEAAALGAGYYAAKLSPFYTAKAFSLQENYTSSLFFTVFPPISKKSKPERRLLLSRQNAFGSVVSITLQRMDDFSILLFDEASTTEMAQLRIVNVSQSLSSITGFDPTIRHENNTHIIRVQIRLTEGGTLDVDEVEAEVRYSANSPSRVKLNATSADEEAGKEEPVVTKLVSRVKSIPLDYSLVWTDQKHLVRQQPTSLKKLNDIDMEEEEKHLKSQSKNNLESYIFWAKADGVLDNMAMTSRMGEDGLKKFSSLLEATQLWLEEERGSEDACTRSEYDNKLIELKDLLQEVTADRNDNKEEEVKPSEKSDGGSEGDL